MKINIVGDRVDWMKENRILVIIILLFSATLSLYFGLLFWKEVWKIFLITGLLSFFYVWRIPGLKGKNLRDISGIKIYVIAIVWVIITVTLPFFVSDNQSGISNVTLFISEILFMIAITIPFDIRDVNLDESTKKTIPQLIGVKNSTYISIILLIISQLLMQSLFSQLNWGIILLTLIALPILYKSNPERKELYFSGVIDGLLILQPVLLYLFNF